MARRSGVLELSVAVAAMGWLVGCSADPGFAESDMQRADEGPELFPEVLTPRMRWAENDQPRKLVKDPEYKFSELPTSGKAEQQPWPGFSWNAYLDSINLKWQGPKTLSPAGKYAVAKGLSVQEVEDAVSKHYGIDAHAKHSRPCTLHLECNELNDEVCAKRPGSDQGVCIPKWFGGCHALAPASISGEEPTHHVEWGGVVFYPNDIKALFMLAHDHVDANFVSSRCEHSEERGEIVYDAFGRPTTRGCIDTNPGTLLVTLANKMGRLGESFIGDFAYDAEVQNYAISSYQLRRVKALTAAEANAAVGALKTGPRLARKRTLGAAGWLDIGTTMLDPTDALVFTADAKSEATDPVQVYVRRGTAPKYDDYDCVFKAGAGNTCKVTGSTKRSRVFIAVGGPEGT